MRISDWSSDVCSSDLFAIAVIGRVQGQRVAAEADSDLRRTGAADRQREHRRDTKNNPFSFHVTASLNLSSKPLWLEVLLFFGNSSRCCHERCNYYAIAFRALLLG